MPSYQANPDDTVSPINSSTTVDKTSPSSLLKKMAVVTVGGVALTYTVITTGGGGTTGGGIALPAEVVELVRSDKLNVEPFDEFLLNKDCFNHPDMIKDFRDGKFTVKSATTNGQIQLFTWIGEELPTYECHDFCKSCAGGSSILGANICYKGPPHGSGWFCNTYQEA